MGDARATTQVAWPEISGRIRGGGLVGALLGELLASQRPPGPQCSANPEVNGGPGFPLPQVKGGHKKAKQSRCEGSPVLMSLVLLCSGGPHGPKVPLLFSHGCAFACSGLCPRAYWINRGPSEPPRGVFERSNAEHSDEAMRPPPQERNGVCHSVDAKKRS